MTHLRSAVIRLAHARPELRPHLLPLLKSSRKVDLFLSRSTAQVSHPETGESLNVPYLIAENFSLGSNPNLIRGKRPYSFVAVSDRVFDALRRYHTKPKF